MMRPDERDAWRRADALLLELLELPATQRPARLETLEIDPALRLQVGALLAAAESEGGPLDSPIDWRTLVAAGTEPPPASLAGRRFGAYELDEEIGRGGMAVVYRAHRIDGAFDQEVAVKILGVGLLPTSAAARFHREQELLARLRHPRIATLLDGGVAEDGTPYLVMERIEGQPIDRYADQAKLDAVRRVELLSQVCEAVAYAHRNLVVHRDLKPGNILVTADGQVKLLDFGIAKLLEGEAAAEATELRSRLLTPGYAAPEQAEGRPVTTATDVYGLGKVMERLLSGIAIDRDLTNIRARCLHPDPERRYADARSLGEDLARWRAGRPVLATPDRLLYRLRKGIARRRGAVAASAIVLAVTAGGVVATLRESAETRRAEREASAVSDFLIGMFEASNPAQSRGRELTVRELLDRGAEQTRHIAGEPLLRARLLEVLGDVYQSLSRYEEALALWREAVAILQARPDPPLERIADLRDGVGVMLTFVDRLDEAETELKAALESRRRLLGNSHPAVAESLNHLGVLEGVRRGRFEAAEPLLAESVAIRRALGAEGRLELAISLNDLGRCLSRLRRHEEAEAALREALDIHRGALGADHPTVADDLNGLGNALARAGRPAEAEPLQRESLAIRRKLFDPAHSDVVQSLTSLGVVLDQRGKLDEAAGLFAEALAVSRAQFGDGHQSSVILSTHLASVELQRGDLVRAEELYRAALAASSRSKTGTARERWRAKVGLGETLRELGRYSDAEPLLRGAVEEARTLSDAESALARAELELGRLELELGRTKTAQPLLERAAERSKRIYGTLSPSYARVAIWLGACRARTGRAADARALLESALEILGGAYPPDHPEIRRAQQMLAAISAAAPGST